MSAMPPVRVDALLAGTAKPYARPGGRSAIDKHPLDGEAWIGEFGLAGDERGDPRVHGGPDKAIHYRAWRDELGARSLLQAPGAFGENLGPRGLD